MGVDKKELRSILRKRKAMVQVSGTETNLFIAHGEAEFLRHACEGKIVVTYDSETCWIEASMDNENGPPGIYRRYSN